MRLVDSHAHLQADRFAADVDTVVEAARRAGVERILVPGWNRASSEAALELARRFDWLDVALGVHPHEAATEGAADWGWIAEAARDGRVVAVGETGLDFDRMFSPPNAQVENLRRNLALALELGKPAIVHCRSAVGRTDAQEALVHELKSAGFGRASAPPPIIHSFSGSPSYARAVIDLGAVVSFSGLVFRAGEGSSAEAARLPPAGRLLVETDSPYLSPPGAPRRRNEPAYVGITGAWLAEQRSVDPEELGDSLVAAYDATFPRQDRSCPLVDPPAA